MKIDARRVEELLREPGALRGVLFFGDDVGLVRERAGRLVRAVAGSTDDPFRVVELDRDAFGRIPAEVASLALTGGRRVVRVREAADGAATHVEAAMRGHGEGFLVIEAAGVLPPRSKLRTLFERSAELGAVGCYPADARALAQTIREVLGQAGVGVDAEAVRWLEGRLGADRAATSGELQKLALYAGAGGTVDLAAARACVGDLAGLSSEDAMFAATAGDVAAADRALDLAFGEGAAPVALLRAALGHVQRLHRAALAMAGGLSAGEAAKAARPPVFFRREPVFARALAVWPAAALEGAARRLWEAERSCKRTGAPAESLARAAILGLAWRAAAARREARG